MIFLTGASGLLGLHILAHLRSRGDSVLALARTPASAEWLTARGAEILPGDVADPAPWQRVRGVTAIIHSAAVIVSPGGWDRYERVNVGATRLAAQRARDLGVPLIHISSVAVYGADAGEQPPGAVAEDYPIGARDVGDRYARSKRLAEDVVREEMARGLVAVMLRPCVVYGVGDRLFLPGIVRHARRGFFPLVGAGQASLPIVHAANVAAAVGATLGNPAAGGRAFNVTNDGELTGLDFVAGLGAGLGRPVRALHLPTGAARGLASAVDRVRGIFGPPFPSFRASVRFLEGGNPFTSAALIRDLGWTPVVSHREALPAAVRDAASLNE